MPTLLLVDDEPNLLYSLKRGLESDDVRVLTAETAEQGIQALQAHGPDVVLLDVRLPDMSGLEAFAAMRRIDPRLTVVLFTAYSTAETAIEAMKLGAYDYLLKPVDLGRLQEVVQRAMEVARMTRVPAMLADEDDQPGADRIIGQSAAMQEVYKAIGRVAPQDVTVLITGESGTGKELVARAVFHHSRRSEGPFLAINCAALPESLLESELFGHERGAFTGADRRRIGKFEQVDRGTIFLDEIGDMSGATQAKVLRLLQDGSLERVGSNDTIRVDVRVIAATNRKLEELVAEGKFREDLFYRLNVFAIDLPPLRRRREDLPPLIDYFVRRFSRELGKRVVSISPEALHALQQHDWPGNVRELQSAVKYALVRAAGEVLTPECLPAGCRGASARGEGAGDLSPETESVRQFVQSFLGQGESDVYRRIHSEIDRILLPQVLNVVGGNQVQASEILGISRSTLRSRIADLGLTFEKRLLTDEARDEPARG